MGSKLPWNTSIMRLFLSVAHQVRNPHLTNGNSYSIYVEDQAITLYVEAADYSGGGRFLSTPRDYESALKFALDLAKYKSIQFVNHIDPVSNWEPSVT